MRCIVEVDLVQAEWIVTAYLANDPRMLEVVRTRADPHVRTGSLISGAPEDFVAHEAGIVKDNTDPEVIAEARKQLPKEWGGLPISRFYLPYNMSIRQIGKKCNHGLNYGMEYRRFALETLLEERQAEQCVRIYRDVAYPGLKNYYKMTLEELRRNDRALVSCFKHKRQFRGRWDTELWNAAYSWKPQSTVAAVTNYGVRGYYHDHDRSMRDVHLLIQSHDSIVSDHGFESFDELHTQCSRCCDHLTSVLEYSHHQFILDTEVKVGVTWGSRTSVKRLTPEGLEEALAKSREVAAQHESQAA